MGATDNGDQMKWRVLYFDEWVAREGLDLIRGYAVDNVYTLPLKPWARTGGSAAQIQLDGTGNLNAAYVCEIPPGKTLNPMKHLYEEIVYILRGRGSTLVEYPGKPPLTFEWGPSSLFCIPLNATYRHFNLSGQEPARYVAVTTAPIVLNLYRNEDFVFHSDAQFPERFVGEHDYFSQQAFIRVFKDWGYDMPVAFSNFFASTDAFELWPSNRGADTWGMLYEMANGVMGAHTMKIPGGTFTKVHRHGPGAHVLWLTGDGYTIMWPEGGEHVRANWHAGAMVVPPAGWWHMHGIVGTEPARHMALKLSSQQNRIDRESGTMQSTRTGGNQMEFEDMPPELLAELRGIFEEECNRRGTPVRMDAVVGV